MKPVAASKAASTAGSGRAAADTGAAWWRSVMLLLPAAPDGTVDRTLPDGTAPPPVREHGPGGPAPGGGAVGRWRER
ncbi:hypothetical protein KNE206_13870 [Kitasatospora sp. NE20-6]